METLGDRDPERPWPEWKDDLLGTDTRPMSLTNAQTDHPQASANLSSNSSEMPLDIYDEDDQNRNRAMEAKKGYIDNYFQLEETHLARWLFRRGMADMQHCMFQEGFIAPQAASASLIGNGNVLDDAAKHPYQPLHSESSFRLLALEPGLPGSDIVCRFVHAELSDGCPAYEAISYAWGDPTDTTRLLCMGHSIKVTRNLRDVLDKIRSPNYTRYVWADAACINQKDPFELGKQVSIMRSIYQNADRVLVWLGKDTEEHAYTAFTLICTIIRQWRIPLSQKIEDGFAEYMGKISAGKPEEFQSIPKASDPVWISLRAMFSLTWFHRLWVIQEVTVPKSVLMIWGDLSIPWPLIGLAASWVMTKGYVLMRNRPIEEAYNAFLMYALPMSGTSVFKPLPFSVILGMTSHCFQSTDPRDRIYSLLGVTTRDADPEERLFMQPDYTRPFSTIYTEATRRILQNDMDLRILSLVQHGESLDPEFPSWVPRFDKPSLSEPLGFRDEAGFYANAGELFTPDEDTFSTEIGAPTLTLHGLLHTTIIEVSALPNEDPLGFPPDSEWIEPWHFLLDQLADPAADYRTTWNSINEAYHLARDDFPGAAEAMSLEFHGKPGKYSQREQVMQPKGHLAEFFLYWKERSSWNAMMDTDDWDILKWIHRRSKTTEGSEQCLAALNATKGRRIFQAEDGDIDVGLGPAAAQKGDVVCILFGSIVPYILRPLGGEAYRLIGECFLPGIMKGEVVEKIRETGGLDKQKRRFVIR